MFGFWAKIKFVEHVIEIQILKPLFVFFVEIYEDLLTTYASVYFKIYGKIFHEKSRTISEKKSKINDLLLKKNISHLRKRKINRKENRLGFSKKINKNNLFNVLLWLVHADEIFYLIWRDVTCFVNLKFHEKLRWRIWYTFPFHFFLFFHFVCEYEIVLNFWILNFKLKTFMLNKKLRQAFSS